MLRFFTRFLVGFLLISGQAMAQSFTIHGPLIADGGICTPLDTASFTATIDINFYQNQTWYMDFDFGDGSVDTFAFVTTNVHGTYIFRGSHVYQNAGTYPVKVYARDNANNIRDSILSTVTIGNCQKASGTVYHDYVQNCTRDVGEAPLASQYYRFYRGGVLEHAYLDEAGRFKIPVYTGDTLIPQYGMIYSFSTFATPCGVATFPPITGAVNDYEITLRPMGESYMLTYFCPNTDTMVCSNGGGYVYMPFGIAATSNWYIRMDYGDGHMYGPNQFYTGYPDQSHTYYTPGIYTAKVHLYDKNHYGPVMTMEKTLNVTACHPVKVDIYSDNNNNCQVDSAEFHYDMNIGAGMELYSVMRNGNNSYAQNTDGSITTYIWPGDTVYRAVSLPHYYAASPADYVFANIPATACGPEYITEAIDSTAFSFAGKIKITDKSVLNSGYCVGDTLFINVTAVSLGIVQGTPFRLRCIYSNGSIDTINHVPPVVDTFSLSFTKYILTPGQLDYTIILETANGTIADTVYGSHAGNNCATVKLRTYYDENKNCIKDTNESYQTNYSVLSSGSVWTNSVFLDSITMRLYVPVGGMLNAVYLAGSSPLGGGFYSRPYTTPFCSWPAFTADTASFEVPLVDTFNVQNANLVNFISIFTELPGIPNCDSVFRPLMKADIYGNRNAAKPPLFIYNNGNSDVDTGILITPVDNYLEESMPQRATAPNTIYPYGSYVPGFTVWNADSQIVYQYTHSQSLQVIHCETPKARLFIDLNANCVKNPADPALSGISVVATVNGQTINTITDNNGNVFFNAPNGSLVTITVPQTLNSGQGLSTACVSGPTLSYTFTPGSAVNNFPYSCAAASNDYSILAGHNYWAAGTTDTIYLYPQHTGCSAGTAVLSLVLDPGLNFVSASRPGVLISGQTLSWNIANMAALGAAPVKVAVNLNGTVTGGSLCNTAALIPGVPDANPANNTFVLCDSISGVVPSLLKTGIADSIYAQPGQPVVYTIHFQNTTAAPVLQVTVVDTISPLLDINSLTILSASHSYINTVLNNNVLKFTFPSILLQPGSTGMIRFALNASGMLTPGTAITNQAAVMYNYQPFTFTNIAMAFNTPGVPLQSGLKDISAVNAAAVNVIDWLMADVAAGSYFELEKSSEGKTFRYLATIPGREHTTTYRYKDTGPFEGLSFYRLKMMSMDGRFSYSPVVSAIWNKKENFGIYAYPNPTQHSLRLKISGNMGNDPVVVISDLGGKQLARIVPGSEEVLVDMSRWANGVYLVRYTDAVHNQTIKITKE